MKRIFLTGYMGAGKTTVGKALAKQMNLSFIDLDTHIEGRYHKTIGQLFDEKGEESFRTIERKMLHEVAEIEDVIIATGGGAPCFFDNMAFMNRMGTTIYLKVSSAELTARLELVKHTRPMLKDRYGEGLKAFIEKNLAKREPWYEQASIIFDAEKMLTERDVENITCALMKLVL